MRKLVFALFFLSGACGLIYQVVWSRMMTEIFGGTVLAVGTVLAAFMAGLALGSWSLGRLGDRSRSPLRLYAAYEVGIGLTAMVSTLLMDRAGALDPALHGALGAAVVPLGAVRFAAAFGLVLAPTVLMGATLPVLARFFIRRLAELGGGLSSLYAVNTAGAVAGALLAGFHLIGTYGVHRSIQIAVCANLAIGVAAWLAAARTGPEGPAVVAPAAEPPACRAGSRPADSRVRLLLWAFGLSGFTSFAYEVFWTRSLVHVLGNSTYAFTMMLTAFLSGIALGGYLVRFALEQMRDRMRWFGWIQILIGASSAAALPALFALLESPALWGFVGGASGELAGVMVSRFLVSLVVMAVPATLIGTTFPLAGRIYARDLRRTGADIGRLYAVNTVGNVLGALAPAVVLLPLFGIQKAVLLLAALNVTIGLFVLAARAERRTAARWAAPAVLLLAVAGLAVAEPGYQFPSQQQMQGDRVLFYREGLSGTTKVFVDPETGEKRMSIDGIVIGGSGMTDYKQQVLAHLPKLLLDDYASELTIGVGSAILAGESARHPALARLVGVEIEPSVVAGAAFFAAENHGVLADPRTEIVIDDVASYLRRGGERFDIISADEKTADQYAANGFSYSREYYRLLRRRLSAGGLVIQWIPTDLPPRQYRMVLRTFAGAFPHVGVWYFPPVGKTPLTSTFVVGSQRRLTIDPRRMGAALKRHAGAFASWEKYGLTTAESVLAHYVGDRGALLRATAGARENSLENPYYEFYSPREYAVPVNRRALDNHRLLTSLRRERGLAGLRERIAGDPGPRLEAAFRAEDEYLAALALLLESAPPAVVGERLDRALALAPWNGNLRCQILAYYWNLGGAHYLRGDYGRARSLLRRAVEVRGEDGEVRYYHALALLRVGAIDAAMAELRRAVDLSPRLIAPRRVLASELRRSGELEAAVDQLRAILAIDPRNLFALTGYAVFLAEHRSAPAEARPLLAAANRLAPSDPAVIDASAWVAYLGGDRASARRRVRAGGRYYEADPEFARRREIILGRRS